MFDKWKKKKVEEQEIQIELPEASYALLKWKESDLPCIAMLNSALKQFSHKEIFAWHLTVTIEFEELIDNGMPSIEEREIVDPFGDKLENEIKAGGNALFLIRETWNGTRCLVWRVYDPDIANQHLEYLANNFQYPRQFNWHMSHDPEWGKAQWYFEQLET